ncbi:MAG: NUDIX hydrolase [Dehalococcoidia bacterium]|nr:NUDIX hydrolase [Dehalococcoidia bacterium]
MEEKSISSDYVYRGKILDVRLETIMLPEGKTGQREIVDHGDSIVVVPVDKDNQIVLVKQYRKALEAFLLEAPAGGIEEDETPNDAALRELQEEIGYTSDSIEYMGGFWIAPGFCNEYMHSYIARDLIESQLPPDEDESIEIVSVPISEIPDLIRSGEIEDAKSISALLMALNLFGLSL